MQDAGFLFSKVREFRSERQEKLFSEREKNRARPAHPTSLACQHNLCQPPIAIYHSSHDIHSRFIVRTHNPWFMLTAHGS